MNIPNPPLFINFQKWTDKNECEKIIPQIYLNNKIIIVNRMVEVPTKKKY